MRTSATCPYCGVRNEVHLHIDSYPDTPMQLVHCSHKLSLLGNPERGGCGGVYVVSAVVKPVLRIRRLEAE